MTSEIGVEGLHLDSTNASTVNNSHANVAFFSPGSTPGVSNSPVLDAPLDSPADNNNCVVESSSALFSISKNTALVVLESLVRSINRNRERTVCERCFHRSNIVRSHIGITSSSLASCVVGIVGANSILSCVGVRSFSHSIVSLIVFESFILPATVATKVLS